jgi:LemA protein
MAFAISAGVLILFSTYVINIFNRLQELKHQIKKAWSNIDVLLKQRNDELPKLIETCKQYQQFEAATLTRIIEARSQIGAARMTQNVPALGKAENQLRSGLGELFAVAEAYPELRANEQFKQLMDRIISLEEGIIDRREFYNEAVNLHNVRIEQFPDLLVASFMELRLQPLLEFSEEETKDVDVGHQFNT